MPSFILTLSCDDKPGIVAGVASTIAANQGNILESAQYGDPDTNQFFMRVAFDLNKEQDSTSFKNQFLKIAEKFSLKWQLYDTNKPLRVILMVSKLGHCLNDLLYRYSIKKLPMELVCVISNHETFRKRVEAEDIPFICVPVDSSNRDKQEEQLLTLIDKHNVDLVVLARYMQILSPKMVETLHGRIINIHHSFLPSFKGARPYHRAHAKGVKLIGATAHYVTADLDEGPIIEQDVGHVDHTMSADDMIEAGRDIENRVLARAVRAHLEHRILLNGQKTVVF
jgi:formyltetrahydrofolate deformylase